jgi:hypothetical protein
MFESQDSDFKDEKKTLGEQPLDEGFVYSGCRKKRHCRGGLFLDDPLAVFDSL